MNPDESLRKVVEQAVIGAATGALTDGGGGDFVGGSFVFSVPSLHTAESSQHTIAIAGAAAARFWVLFV